METSKYIKKCLKQELFVFWPDNEDWVRVSGTNLLFQPNSQYSYRWFLVNNNSKHYIRNCPIENLFSKDSLVRPVAGDGNYVKTGVEEIIDLLPEYLQTQFIFNIDLMSKRKE